MLALKLSSTKKYQLLITKRRRWFACEHTILIVGKIDFVYQFIWNQYAKITITITYRVNFKTEFSFCFVTVLMTVNFPCKVWCLQWVYGLSFSLIVRFTISTTYHSILYKRSLQLWSFYCLIISVSWMFDGCKINNLHSTWFDYSSVTCKAGVCFKLIK